MDIKIQNYNLTFNWKWSASADMNNKFLTKEGKHIELIELNALSQYLNKPKSISKEWLSLKYTGCRFW